MQWFLVLFTIVHFAIANNQFNSIPYYEYDPIQNGWHAVPASHPVMVNLHLRYPSIPEKYQNFANQTLKRKPSGVCQKEVP